MRRLRTTLVALGLTLALIGTSGCGSTTELAEERGRTLQASVLAVTRAAAQGDWREASTLLESARKLLDEGVEQGEVSAMRYRAIDAALDEVEGELTAAQQRASAAEAAATEEAAPAGDATPTQQATTKAVVDRATAPSKSEPAPPREPKKPKKPKKGVKVEPPGKKVGGEGKNKPGDRASG